MKTQVAPMAATMVFLGACGGNVDVSPVAATASSADTCPTLLQGTWKATELDKGSDYDHPEVDHEGTAKDIEQVVIKDMKLTFNEKGEVVISDVPPNRKPEMQANWNTLKDIRCDTIKFLDGDVVIYNAIAIFNGKGGKPHSHRLLGALAGCNDRQKPQMMLYILADKPPPAAVGSIELELPSPLCSSGSAKLQAINLQSIVLEILTHDGRVHLNKQ